MRVLTHVKPDLDALAAVWAAKMFIPGAKGAKVRFVSAGSDASVLLPGDIAVDIDAGGLGIKGEKRADGTVGSAFAQVVERFAPDRDKAALRYLITLVDEQDAHGNAYKRLAPEASDEAHAVFSRTGLNSVLVAYRERHPNQTETVLSRMSEIFDGMLVTGRAWVRAEVEAKEAQIIGGVVAIVRDAREYGVNDVLFEGDVRVVVYVDGHNVGLTRRYEESLRMDHPALRAVVEAAGETVGQVTGTWFAHSTGYLFSWGSRKAPASSPSRVDPYDLARTVYQLLDNGPCWNCDWPSNPERTDCFHCGAEKRVPMSNAK